MDLIEVVRADDEQGRRDCYVGHRAPGIVSLPLAQREQGGARRADPEVGDRRGEQVVGYPVCLGVPHSRRIRKGACSA